MITMAIAVKEPSVTRRYRHMFATSGFETHFVNDVAELIRTVKARPVDVVVFDLGPSAISPVEWLAASAKDKDLEFTPVLWIGTKVPPAMQSIIEEYRPGRWLKHIPLTDELVSAVLQLVGRKTEEKSTDEGSTASLKDWTPEEDTIEDALQIFDEGGASNRTKSANGRTSKGASAHRSESRPSATPAATTSAGTSTPRHAGASRRANASSLDDSIEIDSKELGPAAGPARVAAPGAKQHRQSAPALSRSSVRADAALGGLSDDDVIRITELVVERLSQALATKVDRETIRREVEAALQEADL